MKSEVLFSRIRRRLRNLTWPVATIIVLVFATSAAALVPIVSDLASEPTPTPAASPTAPPSSTPDATPAPTPAATAEPQGPQDHVGAFFLDPGGEPFLKASYVRIEVPVDADATLEARLRAAMLGLVQGPPPAEDGLQSVFPKTETRLLRGVTVSPEGHAVIDFYDFRSLTPQAGTSYGGTSLLFQLHHTVFQFPQVTKVTYTIDGSCDLFWEFQESMCQDVTRLDWETIPADPRGRGED